MSRKVDQQKADEAKAAFRSQLVLQTGTAFACAMIRQGVPASEAVRYAMPAAKEAVRLAMEDDRG